MCTAVGPNGWKLEVQQACRTIVEASAVATRLIQLGVPPDAPSEAVLRGDRGGRAAATRFHPVNGEGTVRWIETTAGFREMLVAAGWSLDDRSQLSRVVHPNRRVAVIVATGDGRTGDPDPHANPTTKYARGPAAVAAISINRQIPGQLSMLTAVSDTSGADPLSLNETVTYYLLYAIDGDQIRIELSRPQGLDVQGRPTAWKERIIIPSVDRGSQPAILPGVPPHAPIDVTVRRRA